MVNHKDGNGFNNETSNLEWVTNQENAIYSVNLRKSAKTEDAEIIFN